MNVVKEQKKRILYAACFLGFVAIDWARNCLAVHYWVAAIQLVSVLVSFFLIQQFPWKKEPWKRYAIGLFACALATVLLYKPWFNDPARIYKQEYFYMMLGAPFLAVFTIRLFDKVRKGRGWKREWKPIRSAAWVVWAAFSLLAVVSALRDVWAFWYFWAFGLFYLTPFSAQDKRKFADGMVDGVLLAFFAFQLYACLARPYYEVRYKGAFFNCNNNALFYLVTYLCVLYRISVVGARLRGRKRRGLPGKRGDVFLLASSYLLAGFVLALLLFTMTRTALVVAVVVTVVYGVLSQSLRKNPRWLTVFCQYFILGAVTAVMVPAAYASIHYLPVMTQRSVVYANENATGEILVEKEVQADRCVKFGQAWTEMFGRLDLKKLLSWEGSVAYAADGSEGDQTLTPEGTGYLLEGEDAANSLKVRLAIYRLYLENLNWRGHTAKEGMYEVAPGQWSYHAQNVFLQAAFSYGIVAGALFLVLAFGTGFLALRRAVGGGGPEKLLPLLVWIAFIGYGLMEVVWLPGQVVFTMFFAVQKLAMGETFLPADD